MNILKLYNDFNIQYTPEGEGHHAGHGWVSTNCPWCDDPSDHLGYNLEKDYFNCFRCGHHPVWETVAKLLNVSVQEAGIIVVRQYGGKGRSMASPHGTHTPPAAIHSREGERAVPPFPSGTTALTLRHKLYLEKRGFDPDKLEREWGLVGTGPVAPLSFISTKTKKQTTIDYKYRIVAPIYWEGKRVSFQARDITGRQDPKYLLCPPELDLLGRANLLYGIGLPGRNRSTGICVEGVTDAWRFGSFFAFATLGTEVTLSQIHLMGKIFSGGHIHIVFDPEDDAQERAWTLARELAFRGVKGHVHRLDCDPGDMSQEDADHFVKSIGGGCV